MQEMIQSLEEDIRKCKEELKTKKLLLASLKLQAKEQVLFSETKFGKALFKTIDVITEPAKRLNQYAVENRERPVEILRKKMLRDGTRLLNQAEKIQKEHKKSKSFAIKCADMVMQLEAFGEKYIHVQDGHLCLLIDLLDMQVQRLRPTPKTELKLVVMGE